jgi:hypothetical protein
MRAAADEAAPPALAPSAARERGRANQERSDSRTVLSR